MRRSHRGSIRIISNISPALPIISNCYYLKHYPLSLISRYLKPLSDWLLSQTLIISTAHSLSQTLDIFPLSQNTHYLNCPFIISNARQFSIISKYSLSQLPSLQKPIISDNLETCLVLLDHLR